MIWLFILLPQDGIIAYLLFFYSTFHKYAPVLCFERIGLLSHYVMFA